MLFSMRPDLVDNMSIAEQAHQEEIKNRVGLPELSLSMLDRRLEELAAERFSPKRRQATQKGSGANHDGTFADQHGNTEEGFLKWLMDFNPCAQIGSKSLCDAV